METKGFMIEDVFNEFIENESILNQSIVALLNCEQCYEIMLQTLFHVQKNGHFLSD